MKTILLTIKQLPNFIARNALVFSIYFAGVFFAALIVIYAYGNIVPTKYMETVTAPSYRTIAVHFPDPISPDEEHLHALDEYQIQDAFVSHVTDMYIPGDDGYVILRAFRDNNRGNEIVFCELFQEDELTGNRIIVSVSHKGDTIAFAGIDYDIVKKVSFLRSDLAFIPIQTFLENQISVNAISYVFAGFPSMGELAAVNQELIARFPGATIVNPPDRFEGLLKQDIYAIQLICVIFLFCVLFFLILMQYMVRQNAPEYTVYGLVGARRLHVWVVILLQNLLFFFCAFLLAASLHMACYSFFDIWLNFTPGVTYTLREYLLLFGILIVITVIAQLPFIWRFTRKNPITARRELLN